MKQQTKIIFVFLFLFFISSSIIYAEEIEEQTVNKFKYTELFNKKNKAGRDESLNAAPYYEKAFELYVNLPDDFNDNVLQLWPEDIPKLKLSTINNWLLFNSAALEQLKAGSLKADYWEKYENEFLLDNLPHYLTKIVKMSLALTFRAKNDVINGDLDDAISDLECIYSLGNHLMGPKFLINQLVGFALKSISSRTGREILDKRTIESEHLKELQDTFISLSKDNKKISFIAEKFLTCDSLNLLFTNDGNGGSYITEQTFEQQLQQMKKHLYIELSDEEKQSFRKINKLETLELLEKVFNYIEASSDKTPWQLKNEKEDFEEKLSDITKDNFYASQFITSVPLAMEIYHRQNMETEATIATIAILRYKSDKGKYPDTLEKLTTDGYLDTIPMDVYSDKPIIYKKAEDNFILYSLGPDFDDDNGTSISNYYPEEDGDYVIWPLKNK